MKNTSCQVCLDFSLSGRLTKAFQYVRQIDLQTLRTSAQQGCSFCQLFHTAVSLFGHLFDGRIESDIKVTIYRWYNEEVTVALSWDERPGDYDAQYTLYLYMQAAEPGNPMDSRFKIRRHILDPKSDQCINLIKNWVHACCNDEADHAECTLPPAFDLPTRVVDVGTFDGTQNPILKETRGEKGTYIALSHCWGRKQIIRTTKSTLETHKSEIKWSALSKTFKEAITVTRKLGVRYIWIDSLCIIQDDPQDWEVESTKMADIYEGAYLTIAATAAASGEVGLYKIRSPPKQIPIPGYKQPVFVELKPKHNDFGLRKRAEAADAPLLSRAWVFQERILSSRIIHFGAEEMLFECKSKFLCECGGVSTYTGPYSREQSFKQSFAYNLKTRSKPDWQELVREYTARAITFEQDRLPALSAVARRLQPLMGKYIAGIWYNQLPGTLLWSADPALFETPTSLDLPWRPARRSNASAIPPTWTWASIEGAVVNIYGVQEAMEARVEVLEADTTPLLNDLYGVIANGYIKLKGIIIPVLLHQNAENTCYTIGRGASEKSFKPDIELSLLGLQEIACLLIAVSVSGVQETLIVELVDASTCQYRRLGMLQPPPEWFEGVEETIVTLV